MEHVHKANEYEQSLSEGRTESELEEHIEKEPNHECVGEQVPKEHEETVLTHESGAHYREPILQSYETLNIEDILNENEEGRLNVKPNISSADSEENFDSPGCSLEISLISSAQCQKTKTSVIVHSISEEASGEDFIEFYCKSCQSSFESKNAFDNHVIKYHS